MRKFLVLFFLVAVLECVGCGGRSSITSVVVQDPYPDTPWSGRFYIYGGTLYPNDVIEIRWEGYTPPPSFEIKVTSDFQIISPGLDVYVKYTYQDRWWGRYEMAWFCVPRYWVHNNYYVVSILVGGEVIASARFRYYDPYDC